MCGAERYAVLSDDNGEDDDVTIRVTCAAMMKASYDRW